MPKINKTQYAILGILSIRPGSGYEIKKFCDEGLSHYWNENYGHIYPVLKRMEKEGLIEKTVEQCEGKPLKNIYFLTSRGRDVLQEWLMLPVEYSPARIELLLKLVFGNNLPKENIIEKLRYEKQNNEKKLHEYREIEKNLLNDENGIQNDGYSFWLATLRYGIYMAEASIKWSDETVERIKQQEES